MIQYRETKNFKVEDIQALFLSLNWESGQYPERIVQGLQRSSLVISAWDGDRLAGLIRGLDDGATAGFIHYLLVDPEYQGQHIGGELMRRLMEKYQDLLYVKVMPSDPKTIPFYEKFGFEVCDGYAAMQIKRITVGNQIVRGCGDYDNE